jgi:hypothetical protein
MTISIGVKSKDKGEKIFKALSEGGNVVMPYEENILVTGLWHVRRSIRNSLDGQYGIADVTS